jgi:protein-disulfide isomerase
VSTLKVAIGSQDHVQGDEHALVTLVEYGDYECPHCGRAYPIVKRVQKHFGERVRVVFRNFPLGEMHPHAESAAETAEFAGAQGKFWEMHDLLFENQDRLGGGLYLELAQELGLASEDLREALEKREFQARVRADFAGGVRSGVNGTPTFFINGQRHDAAFEYGDLVEAIDRAMKSLPRARPA